MDAIATMADAPPMVLKRGYLQRCNVKIASVASTSASSSPNATSTSSCCSAVFPSMSTWPWHWYKVSTHGLMEFQLENASAGESLFFTPWKRKSVGQMTNLFPFSRMRSIHRLFCDSSKASASDDIVIQIDLLPKQELEKDKKVKKINTKTMDITTTTTTTNKNILNNTIDSTTATRATINSARTTTRVLYLKGMNRKDSEDWLRCLQSLKRQGMARDGKELFYQAHHVQKNKTWRSEEAKEANKAKGTIDETTWLDCIRLENRQEDEEDREDEETDEDDDDDDEDYEDGDGDGEASCDERFMKEEGEKGHGLKGMGKSLHELRVFVQVQDPLLKRRLMRGFSSRVVVSITVTQYNMETWSIATFKGMAIEKLVRQMKGKLEAAASRKSPGFTGFTGTTGTGSTPFGQGNESAERTAESIRPHREQIHSSLMQDLLQRPQERDLFALRLIGKFQDTWLRLENKKLAYYLNHRRDTFEGRPTEKIKVEATEVKEENKNKVAQKEESQEMFAIELCSIRDMPAPKMQVSIPSTTVKISDVTGRSYTNYHVYVACEGMQWTVARRYNHFYELATQLQSSGYFNTVSPTAHHHARGGGEYFPRLPSKHFFTPTSGSFVTKRRQKLEEFLNDLLELHGLSENLPLLSFLGVVSTSRYGPAGERRSVVHVSNLHNFLQFGDIVLFKCRFNAARMQRAITGADYDHVGVIVPGGGDAAASSSSSVSPPPPTLGILEATGSGTIAYSLTSRLLGYAKEASREIVVRRLMGRRTSAMRDQVDAFLAQVLGTSYSIVPVLTGRRELIPKQKKNSNSHSNNQTPNVNLQQEKEAKEGTAGAPPPKTTFFCSQLVASYLRAMGCLVTEHVSSYFWPGSFAEGAEVDACLAEGYHLGPETLVDCRIVELSRAQSTSTTATTAMMK